jgi:DNA modification methylase
MSTQSLDKISEPLRNFAVPLESLRLDPKNVRMHDAKNIAAIKDSLLLFGQQKPVIIDAESVVVAGNGLLAAAKELGWSHIAAVTTALVGAARTGFAIADNQVASTSAFDDELLSAQIKELRDLDLDIKSLGFDEEELATLLDGDVLEGMTDPDDVPLPPDEAITKPGDLWILGEHRLLCSDSSNAAEVDRLLDGAVIDLAYVDPPYNVKVEPRSNNAIAAGNSSFSKSGSPGYDAAKGKDGLANNQGFDVARQGAKHATTEKLRAKDRPLENDFLSDEAFEKMLDAWFGNMARVLKPGGSFYCWGGYANIGNYPGPLKRAGLYFSQTIIWDKKWAVLTRKDFMGAHEWAFYGWKEGAGHKYYGPNNETDIWHIKKDNPQSYLHLTQKPVELAVRAIQYSSLPGQNVLDLFGGSGSTLIACHQTGRRAFLMEIDPLYTDVIVARFEKFSGQKAKVIHGLANTTA